MDPRRSLGDLLFGRPLANREQARERIGSLAGVPLLGLDALASAAYGPEAALTQLLPLGALGLAYLAPLTVTIIVLLALVYVSYRQTIAAYPGGGGSYTVARANLGPRMGLVAAAALALDYILNVAVGISAGVGAIVSAVPSLLPHTLPLCLALLALLTIINLRGVREAGLAFLAPTYLFVGCLAIALALGAGRVLFAGAHAVVPPPHVPPARAPVTAWILVRAFGSGCTAMTGVEAVSNGVPLFRPPPVEHARRTLTIIIAILIVLLGGIAYLAPALHVGATVPGSPGYESVLSQLIAAAAGRGWFYSVSIASVFAVLALSANTSFADFPRLCRLLAIDQYLPEAFAHRGRRLVFSHGIVALALVAGALLIVFRGITDRLIPLFAVGAFLAFTLSQAGMVMHWWRERGRHWRKSLVVNAVGAIATCATVAVVLVAKFFEGAWITALVLGLVLLLFSRVRAHYAAIAREIATDEPLDLAGLDAQPIVVVPLRGWSRVTQKALRFALKLSPDVRAVQVRSDDPGIELLASRWRALVEEPARRAGVTPPKLDVVPSSFRETTGPLLDYVFALADAHPGRVVAVVVPQLVEHRWYHYWLHNQRATLIKGLLLLKGRPSIVVINTPWYLGR
ncbi:MAG TPA: APC family permease [Polyangia bacterium]|nr:APC family permease [Polyangia bacterium]